jgi:hypothetical protein
VSDKVTDNLVGAIRPSPDGEKPLFRVVRREARMQWEEDAAGVRPCDHPNYILDEKWQSVTCGECRERLDAFAVLLTHAEYTIRMKHERQRAEYAERDLQVAELRRLSRLRSLTPDESAEIEKALVRSRFIGGDSLSLSELREISHRVRRQISERPQLRTRIVAKPQPCPRCGRVLTPRGKALRWPKHNDHNRHIECPASGEAVGLKVSA